MNSTLRDTATIDKLISLHNENILKYKNALRESLNIGGDMKAIFQRILEESLKCSNELKRDEKKGNNITGDLFCLNEVDLTRDRKTILSHCLNDVLMVLNYYPLLLSSDLPEIERRSILAAQQESVKNLYTHIKQFHDAQ